MPEQPFYPKFPADYSADTRQLTYEQHGLYNLLLDELWLRGSLPDDGREIAGILGKDPRSTARIYDTIRHFFHVDRGMITSKKLEKIRSKVKKVSEKRAGAARARWNGANDSGEDDD